MIFGNRLVALGLLAAAVHSAAAQLFAQVNSLGACCLEQKGCIETIAENCPESVGSFQGQGTLCIEYCPARVSTGFSYNGQLKENGLPYSGLLSVQFSLWDLPIDGELTEGPLILDNVVATSGFFRALVDFGEGAFGASARWLEVAVCTADCSGPSAFTILSPRQLMTPVPFALQTRGLVVDGEGNVGIGSDTPTNKLSVAGHANVLGNFGIGTDTPTAMLHIARPLADTGIRFQSSRYVAPITISANRPPATAANVGTGVPWNSPTAAIGSNDSRTEVTLTGTAEGVDALQSQFLDLTNLGFLLPVDAQVVGFQVAVEARGTWSCADCDGGGVSLYPRLLGETASGPLVGSQGLSQNDSTINYGGPTSTGGINWTAAQVNSSTFGVRLQAGMYLSQLEYCLVYPLPCVFSECDCAASGTVGVDAVNVTVYYYEAPTQTNPLNWSVGVPQGSSNLHVAPTADLSSPIVTVTPQGIRIGATTNAIYGLELPNTNQLNAYARANAWFTHSSRRWKENIDRIPKALDKLLQLDGVMFDWKPEQGGQRDIGFVAEDVAKVVPELVNMETNGEFASGMKYDRVTALAVEAIKELDAKCAKKEQELQELRQKNDDRINELESRIKKLEQERAGTPP